MPELPEVETVRRDCEATLIGHTINRVEVCHRKPINGAPEDFAQALKGKKFLSFSREGKMITAHLSGGLSLAIHLKMTGQLIIAQKDGELSGGGHPDSLHTFPNAHTRIIFHCSDGAMLYFNDQRLFGWVHLIKKGDSSEFSARLGPDAFTALPQLDYFQVYQARYPRRTIKAMLLDQGFIAGIGNIYADEICWAVKVHPAMPLSSIDVKKMGDIRTSIRSILKNAVACRGTTFRSFVDGSGMPGGYVTCLEVYGRAGLPCSRCKTLIVKEKHAQRGTAFCPKCQHSPLPVHSKNKRS